MTNKPPSALDVHRKSLATIESRLGSIVAKGVEPRRIVSVMLSALMRDEALCACTPASVMRCVLAAAEMGLEIGGVRGEMYAIPFRDGQSGATHAQPIIGYRGLVKLMRRGGVKAIDAWPVFNGETFRVSAGIERNIVHEPDFDNIDRDDYSQLRLCYAVVWLDDDTFEITIMSKREIENVRQQSRAGNSGPWRTHPVRMALKTVLRRASNLAPMASEVAETLARMDQIEIGAMPPSASPLASEHDLGDVAAEPSAISPEMSQRHRELREQAEAARGDIGSDPSHGDGGDGGGAKKKSRRKKKTATKTEPQPDLRPSAFQRHIDVGGDVGTVELQSSLARDVFDAWARRIGALTHAQTFDTLTDYCIEKIGEPFVELDAPALADLRETITSGPIAWEEWRSKAGLS